jgi:hypothetical protein
MEVLSKEQSFTVISVDGRGLGLYDQLLLRTSRQVSEETILMEAKILRETPAEGRFELPTPRSRGELPQAVVDNLAVVAPVPWKFVSC